MRVLIAGAAGAIGTRLVPQLLAHGDEVTATNEKPREERPVLVTVERGTRRQSRGILPAELTNPPQPERTTHRLERTYATTPQALWTLWTTSAGIESWWAPEGFEVAVATLDLRTGGELVYMMTATAPEQMAFMERAGMPLTTKSRKTFTEVDAPTRIAYDSLVDFVPGVEPYAFSTIVDFEPAETGVKVTMTVEAMHDDVWTQRLLAGRANELDNLASVVDAGARPT